MIEVVIHIANKKVLNMKEFREAFNQLADGKHLVIIKDMRKRSIPQNSYYWGCVVPLIRRGLYDAGFDEIRTNDQAHAIIKRYHLKNEVVNKETGEVLEQDGSTTELNIPGFNEFIERVCRWASEYLGIVIPSPNEQFAVFEEWEDHTVNYSSP